MKQYYKEFFSTDYSMEEDDGIYTFKNADGGGYIFDTRLDDVTITDIKTFDADPNFVTTTSKTFLSETGSSSSTMHDKIISLKSYGIDIHGDKDDAYVPLTLLSNFSGGPQFYQVAYNGKDIYVLDMMGVMYPGGKRDTQYFKDTYYEVIGDVAASRPEDLAKYSYNQLCLSFDNERGYTSQLVFGAKYLVLDLSTNGGGDEAALCGIMGLFNKAESSMAFNNVMHRGRSTTDYGVDINLDGECDAADVAEAEGFDFKVAVLTSKCSFSCGNLLPSLMKEAGYKIVGEQSGGGSCAVTYEFTADGLPYVRSSYSCLSNERGDNIDTGVPLDYDIAKELGGLSREEAAPHFYDAKLISTYLEGAYQ